MKIFNKVNIFIAIFALLFSLASSFGDSCKNYSKEIIVDDESGNYRVKRIENPRVVVDIKEVINGLKDERSASNWIKERSDDYRIRVVEADKTVALAAKRADILGRTNEACLRKEGVISNYDYFIQGKVSGHQRKEKGLYGSKDGIRFSLGMDISAIEAATGEVIATTVILPQDILIRNVASEQAAAREAINRLMKGSEESIGADELFRKMESHWTREKHLGELYRMEFAGLDLEKADLLKRALSSISGINEPRVCSVDTVGISVLECQTQLKSLELASLVQKTITGFKLERSDAHYLSFRDNGEDIKVLNDPPKIAERYSPKDNFFDKYWQEILVVLLTPSPLAARKIRGGVWKFSKMFTLFIFSLLIKRIQRNKKHENS